MLDDTPTDESTPAPEEQSAPAPRKRTATRRTATTRTPAEASPAEASPAKESAAEASPAEASPAEASSVTKPAKKAAAKKAAAKKTSAKKAAAPQDEVEETPEKTPKKTSRSPKKTKDQAPAADAADGDTAAGDLPAGETAPVAVALPLFKAPEPTTAPRRRTRKVAETTTEPAGGGAADSEPDHAAETEAERDAELEDESGGPRRRRRRGGRRRRKAGDPAEPGEEQAEEAAEAPETGPTEPAPEGEPEAEGGTRRRRRRRRAGDEGGEGADDSATATRVRQRRTAEDQITAVSGSTRLEAKKQRRREGREAGRRRAPIVSEAEFLARRESVERVMVIRQREDLTQIAVIEDKVLVEHYVARESQTSLIGNVYLGRVQNVLPSMEAAFIDIGKGRNAVLYAGEVNWSGLGHQEGQPRKIESVLSSGQTVLVQVTKDPVGHKGARLTSQISLAGRFLVYVPDGTTSGISRKLPDTERNRLKTLLRDIVPDTAGVIVRTAAEGASEEELTRDVERLKARWEDIERKASGSAPALLYGEPDLTLKVVRDLFTEDFSRLVIEGDDAWDTVQAYVAHVAPDLEPRLQRYERPESGVDVFAAYRIDEQIAKGLDRKVWLPSGGSLVIDRTEAMTVVDVNTGKFTGSGGNLEETVTKNNLEAAEEIVRQLRLRDIGGIIVIDFIDMVLESNRDLVLRRLVECLGRDRTRHQVAEVTSLGLVQMTRKRIGTGLLEAFSQSCEHCQGRGVIVHEMPVEPKRQEEESRRARRPRTARARGAEGAESAPVVKPVPSPRDVAAAARPEAAEGEAVEEASEPELLPIHEHGAPEEATEAPEAVQAVEPEDTEATEVAEPETPEAVEPEAVEPEAVEPEAVEAAEPAPAQPAAAAPDQVTETAGPAGAPVVVTRARRRRASRPAGPPSAAELPSSAGHLGDPVTSGAVEPGTASIEPGGSDPVAAAAEEHHVEHVPIKKKGARKR